MKLTHEQLRKLVSSGRVSIDVAHSIITKKNPSPVAKLPADEPEHQLHQEPVGQDAAEEQGQERGKGGVRLRFRVLLVRCGLRYIDDDNLAAACKALRDQIAEELNIDDGDPAIEWEYGQVRTRGAVGTIVRIERL